MRMKCRTSLSRVLGTSRRYRGGKGFASGPTDSCMLYLPCLPAYLLLSDLLRPSTRS